MRRARTLRRFFMGLALAGLLAGAASAAGTTSPEGARKFVQDLASRAVAMLGNYKTGDTDRSLAQFRDLVREGFDLELIGRFALGNSWRSATPAQQQEYQRLFATYVLDSYSRRLGAYKDESFKVTGAGPYGSSDALIQTEIDRPDGAPITAGWRVRDIDGHMKIIDVIVEGVSMALTQRQEFASVVQRSGLDGLIDDLRGRVKNLQAQANPG